VPYLKRLRETLGHVTRTIALVWRSSPAMTCALAALTLVASATPIFIAWAGKRIIDAVVAREPDAALRWVAIELCAVVVSATASRGLGVLRTVLGARLGVDVNVAILEKATRLSLSHFEDSEYYDALTRARREASSRPVALVTEAFALVQNALTLVGYAALLYRYSPLAMLLLALATVPATVAEMRRRGPGLRGQLKHIEVPGCGHAPALNVLQQLEWVTAFIEAV